MIVTLGVRNPLVLLVIAMPIAYLLGVLSWLYIEKPTQRLTKYLHPRALVAPATSAQRELQLQS
jgi:peptidoglycan/LPS O-acetylase OafA/YrhL